MIKQTQRVSIPELKSLIAEVNRNYFRADMIPREHKRMFSLPSRKSKNVVILEFEPNPKSRRITLCTDDEVVAKGWMYLHSHRFYLPREAKDFLVERLNWVLLTASHPDIVKDVKETDKSGVYTLDTVTEKEKVKDDDIE